jgi:hypothetical protein
MSKFHVPDKVLYVCTGREIIRIECTDRCDYAPVCSISPGNIWLKEYSEKEVLKLLDS